MLGARVQLATEILQRTTILNVMLARELLCNQLLEKLAETCSLRECLIDIHEIEVMEFKY